MKPLSDKSVTELEETNSEFYVIQNYPYRDRVWLRYWTFEKKKKIPVGMIHLVVSYFSSFFFFCIYTNLEGNKAMFISLEYLFLATKKNYKFQKAENMAFSEPYQSQSRKFFKLIFIEAKKSLVIWKFRNFHDSWIKIEILKNHTIPRKLL